jgi:hypothetical protein
MEISVVKLIISGGQSGADLSGNEFAREVGIPTKINAYSTFSTYYAADLPVYKSFAVNNLDKDPTIHDFPHDRISMLRYRTRYNVKNSDATIIFVTKPLDSTRGSRLTARYCVENNKNFIVINLNESPTSWFFVKEFITAYNPSIINIAGERFCDREAVKNVLRKAWSGA